MSLSLTCTPTHEYMPTHGHAYTVIFKKLTPKEKDQAMVAYTLISAPGRQGQVDLYEFETSLVNRTSSPGLLREILS